MRKDKLLKSQLLLQPSVRQWCCHLFAPIRVSSGHYQHVLWSIHVSRCYVSSEYISSFVDCCFSVCTTVYHTRAFV